MPKRELRKDITGLRAIAVLAVTLFHISHLMNPESLWFKGGFLGVDIFFVISGFLMTMLIMRGLEQGNFSLYDFYKRRAKRICPALVTVVLVSSLVTICIFNDGFAERTLKDGLRALGFVSNFRFARLTGYFEADSSERMFLHTWSLSVEWQFYLIYPVLMLLLGKIFSRKNLGRLLVILTLASLIFGCIYTVQSPTSSYYYLPSRAFELLTGSLAYFYPLSFFIQKFSKYQDSSDNSTVLASNSAVLANSSAAKIAKYAEYVGLICIAISLMVIGEEDGWPTLWALLPMFGTWLCIAANNQNTILFNSVIQHIGLWSYSIYLVHWPIIVTCFVLGIHLPIWLLFILIFASGIALHYGIERRRNYGWGFLSVYLAVAGLIYFYVYYVILAESNQQSVQIQNTGDIRTQSFGNNGIADHYGNLDRPVDLILVGDSFARQYLPVLANKEIHTLSFTVDGCYSSQSSINARKSIEAGWIDKCSARYDNLLQAAAEHPNVPIVWAQNWSGYNIYKFVSRTDRKVVNQSFEDIVKQDLSSLPDKLQGHKLYILSAPRKIGREGNANFGINCSNLHYKNTQLSLFLWDVLNCRERLHLNEQPINLTIQEFIEHLPQNQGKTETEKPMVYLDVSNGFCNEEGCLVMGEENLLPMFSDTAHLSKTGAEYVVSYILQQLSLSNAPLVEPNHATK